MVSIHSRFSAFAALLLVAVFLASGIGVWASFDCCGHPSGTGMAEGHESGDTDGGAPRNNGDCYSACCQTYTAVFLLPHITFAQDPRWIVAGKDEFAESRTSTDIFHPPLA